MAYDFKKISYKDLGKGLDKRSAPNAIPEGFSEVLQNADVSSNGFISKRVGHEGFYGHLPMRVTSVSHTGTEIRFELDGAIDTKSLQSTPIVVQGRLSGAQSGDWSTTDNAEYYKTFTTDIPDGLESGTAATYTLTGARHGAVSSNVFVTSMRSTSLLNNSSSWFYIDNLVDSGSPYNVTYTYTLAADTDVFLYVLDKDTVGGESYVAAQNITAGTSDTISLPTASHALNNFNIIGQVFYLSGTDWVQVIPDSFTVNASTGDVTVGVTNSTASDQSFKVVLSATAATSVVTNSIASGATGTLSISTEENFPFLSVYVNSGGTLTQIIPDSIIRDDDADTVTISITNTTSGPQTYEAYYEFATLTSSSVVVIDNGAVSASYTDASPQLTLWGIPHADAYTTSTAKEGHVTHIDSFRREAEERLVAGLGGNLFTARTRSESGADYLIPSAEVDLENRIAAETNIAPAFQTTGSTQARTRGLVSADDVVQYQALVTGVELVSSGVTKYTLQMTNKSGDLSTAISNNPLLPDYLTVSGMAHSIHNGTFPIAAVDNGADTITVVNASATLADFDETGAAGRAGVFTDQITAQAIPDVIIGDSIVSPILVGLSAPVLAVSGTTVVIGGVVGNLNVPIGVRGFAQRTASIVPMTSTDNFVKGDICSATGLDRHVRIKYVNPSADISISNIEGDGTLATVTLGTDHGLTLGQKVFLTRTGSSSYDGEHTVTDIPTTSSFVFASTATTTVEVGIIKGKTVELDEELTFADSGSAPFTLSVVGRWIPVEAPTPADNLPKSTYTSHLDANSYTVQPITRSAMVADNLYLTNQDDEVQKFDGTNLYQAGLFRWQPQLFAQLSTSTASIPVSRIKASYTAVSNTTNKFTVDTAALFFPGDVVVDEDTGTELTVSQVDPDNNLIFVIEDTSGISTSGTPANNVLRKATRYRYYFRLDAIDANRNVIASAATGANDFAVDLSASGQIRMRLVGLPAWGNLDFDSLDIQVYRTKGNKEGPFYLLRNLDVSFNAGDGYIDVNDGTIDDLLLEFDNVSVALKGAELGTAWTQPLRAKYVTTADNRLILANLKDYPELDIIIRKSGAAVGISGGDLSGKRVLFRKDSTDTGTTTNMVDRVGLEFVTSGAVTIDPAADIASDAATFTITETAHGLVAGDWVYLFHAAVGPDNDLNFAGWWQIASKTANTFTVNFNGGYTPSAADVDRYVAASSPADVPVWLGTDGNYNQRDMNTVDEFTSIVRLSNGINVTQRLCDTTVSGFTTFVPWMIAQAGSEIGVGRLVVRQESVFDNTFAVKLPTTPSTGAWFVQGTRRAGEAEISASTRLLSSRLIASYPNYPEIFEGPFGDASASDSVIDINPSDGEEITGVIPFFGDAVFGTGQVESALVVFKTNSIYLVDVNTRQISKIQSRGLGCTAPYSIASTRDGIMFANQSGIYRLNRDQSVSYVGKFIERLWQDDVNSDSLSLATGHHYGIGSKYKLSVPVGQSTNNQVFVYDHQREGKDQEFGAWTQYTNHNATGWANLGNDAFFATTDGQVFRLRNTGDETDYRDDASAVAEMVVTLRADDFGVAGSRKIIHGVVSHFHLRRSSMTGTTLYSSEDLDGTFRDAGTFNLVKDDGVKVETINSSLGRRRCVYVQLKYVNSTKDEDVVLSGVDYQVALMGSQGIKDQGNS